MIDDLERDGFWCGPLFNETEIGRLRTIVNQHFCKRIQRLHLPINAEIMLCDGGLWAYASTYRMIDHANVWPLKERLFEPYAVTWLQKTSAWRKLQDVFDDCFLTSEEDLPNRINWRMIRPKAVEDLGPAHADQWFWTANKWPWAEGRRPYKIWVMVGAGDRGFGVIPGSHRQKYPYSMSKRKDGKWKPHLEVSLPIEPLVTPTGHGVVFDHDLVHAGLAPLGGFDCRVSIEFTVFVKVEQKKPKTAKVVA